jgi:hypothetical protein
MSRTSLDPDVLAAYNEAVRTATLAGGMVARLRRRQHCPEPCEHDTELFKVTLRALYANAKQSREAVNKVASRLNVTPQSRGPAQFGQIVKPNAHLAALDYAEQVRLRILVAVLTKGVTGISDPAFPDIVADHLDELWQMIDLTGLPDAAKIIADVTIEADLMAATTGGHRVKDANGGTDLHQKVDKITQAIGLKTKHPEWTNSKVAKAVGCSPSNLSQSPKYQAVCKGIQQLGKANRPHADKNRGPDMDQYADSGGEQPGLTTTLMCASEGCGGPAGTDADGKPLTHEGKPRCLECWTELYGAG